MFDKMFDSENEQLLLSLLEEPLREGCQVILTVDDGVLCADLHTQAKSDCVLKAQEDGVFAHRRYGCVDRVETPEELLHIVWGCGHGRTYFNGYWLDLFKAKGMESPCGPYRK